MTSPGTAAGPLAQCLYEEGPLSARPARPLSGMRVGLR